MSKNSFGHMAVASPARSKLIPASGDSTSVAEREREQEATTLPVADDKKAAPRGRAVRLDVAKAIDAEAARDPSDPFLAGRLAAHYRQGIWTPTHIEKKK